MFSYQIHMSQICFLIWNCNEWLWASQTLGLGRGALLVYRSPPSRMSTCSSSPSPSTSSSDRIFQSIHLYFKKSYKVIHCKRASFSAGCVLVVLFPFLVIVLHVLLLHLLLLHLLLLLQLLHLVLRLWLRCSNISTCLSSLCHWRLAPLHIFITIIIIIITT